jgi:putative N-acetyltransferase (TIGR04045 family)
MSTCLETLISAPPSAGPAAFEPCEFRIKWAATPWERERAHALRRAVFCVEQGVFPGDDRDAIDAQAQAIVALSCMGGSIDELVGTVRIHEAEPGMWWGSRLAVHAAFRQHGRLGATLIRLAVSSAHAQGCTRFFGHIQAQNVTMFERLHWRALQEVTLFGRPHRLMEADLAHYPPCRDPLAGFVTRASSGAARPPAGPPAATTAAPHRASAVAASTDGVSSAPQAAVPRASRPGSAAP